MKSHSKFIVLYAAFVLLTLLAACGGDPLPVTRFVILTGAQEVPAITPTAAYGSGSVEVDTENKTISGSITTVGIAGTTAHIYSGVVGASGVAVITLVNAASGVWNIPAGTVLTQEQYDALFANGLYVNVHSTVNPNGEIRGQITKSQTLTGAQQVPPGTTLATGIGTLAVNPTSRAIAGGIITNGISGTASHLHNGVVGASGVSIITLSAVQSGVWTIPASGVLNLTQYTDYLAGNLYFNVHSATYPDGEIRGQIEP